MEKNFKVGDNVRIKKEFWKIPSYFLVASDMRSKEGKIARIVALPRSIFERPSSEEKHFATLENTDWNWSLKWLEPVNPEFEKMNDASRIFTEFK